MVALAIGLAWFASRWIWIERVTIDRRSFVGIECGLAGWLRCETGSYPVLDRSPGWSLVKAERPEWLLWGWEWTSDRQSSSFGVPLWPFAILAAIPACVLWVRTAKGRARAVAGRCPTCGYDRRGLAADAACPECGSKP